MSSLIVTVQDGECQVACGPIDSRGLVPLVLAWHRGDPVEVLRPTRQDDGSYRCSWRPAETQPLEFAAFTLLDLPLAALRATWDAREQRFRTVMDEDLLLQALARIDAHVPVLLGDAESLAIYAFLTLLTRMPSAGDIEEFARHHHPHVDRLNGVRQGILGSQEFADKLKGLRPRYALLSDANLPRLLADLQDVMRVSEPPPAMLTAQFEDAPLLLADESLGVVVHVHGGVRYEDGWVSNTLRLRCQSSRPGACLRLKGWRKDIARQRHQLKIRADASETRVLFDEDMFELQFQLNVPARYHIEIDLPALSAEGDQRQLGFVLVEQQLQSLGP